jgi:hypothetical protein
MISAVPPATTYCIDTNSIIDARNKLYPLDLFPGLWLKVEGLIMQGRLCAPEEVRRELEKKDDETKKWAKLQGGLFVPDSPDLISETQRIMAQHPHLVNSTTGRSAGDPFVIALAKIHGHTLITEERKSGNSNHPRIPDVCAIYRMKWIRFTQLIRDEQWKF